MELSKYHKKRAKYWQPVMDSRGNFSFINKEKEHKKKVKLMAFFGGLAIVFLTGLAMLFLTSCKKEAEPIQNNEPTLMQVYKQDTNDLKMFIFKQQKLFW